MGRNADTAAGPVVANAALGGVLVVNMAKMAARYVQCTLCTLYQWLESYSLCSKYKHTNLSFVKLVYKMASSFYNKSLSLVDFTHVVFECCF